MIDPSASELLRRWCRLAQQALGVSREEIDALNVFPVPDKDTGTNVYLTFEAAAAAVEDSADAHDFAVSMRALGRGALIGARGSSGVIVSQLLCAMGEHLAAELPSGTGAEAARCLADAFTRAADAAYTAVAEPVEGTILTVARSVAADATAAAAGGAGVGEVITVGARAGREALARTTDQLEVLRLAGVVDAGSRALCVLLDAAETAVTGRRHPSPRSGLGRPSALLRYAATTTPSQPKPGGPTYEVMYLLDAADGRIAGLREALAPLGDSLVVVGGDGLWNVHVHVDDVGAAVEAGVVAGTPRRIRVTHLAEQSRQPYAPPPPAGARGVVAIATGPGLEELFAAAGATVIAGAPGRRCSASEILAAIRRADCAEVVVLPNDADSIRVAEAAGQAARDGGVRVSVVPTRAQVQGLAALAVHDPGRRFDDDVVTMTAAAAQTRHGAVTIALRDAITMAGRCQSGDVLGVVDGDFAVVGSDVETVAMDVVERLLAAGGELLTLVSGCDADDDLAHRIAQRVRRDHPEVDSVVYEGRQPRYLLLVAVE